MNAKFKTLKNIGTIVSIKLFIYSKRDEFLINLNFCSPIKYTSMWSYKMEMNEQKVFYKRLIIILFIIAPVILR